MGSHKPYRLMTERERDAMRQHNVYRQRRLRGAGLCPRCGKPAAEGRVYCRERLDFKMFCYYASKEAGLCTVCQKEAAREGYTTCLKCALHLSEMSKKRRTERREK